MAGGIGTHRVTLEDLERVRTPNRTRTWRPLPHLEFVLAVKKGLEERGFEVLAEDFSLSPTELEFFGVLYLAKWSGGRQWSVGLRNSNNQEIAAGVCAGLNVLVCSNLVFRGDIIRIRKHTHRLDLDEVEKFVGEALDTIPGGVQSLLGMFDAMAEIPLTEQQAEHVLVQAVVRRALPGSRLKHVWDVDLAEEKGALAKEYPDREVPFGPLNLHQVYQAITRTWRKDHHRLIQKRSRILNRLVEENFQGFLPGEEVADGEE